jgi:hypothetical protein
MAAINLGEFIGTHREEILLRCRAKMAQLDPSPLGKTMEGGIPLFLDQVANELRDGPNRNAEMKASAQQHGRDLFSDGFTVGQLVHDYGGVCQSVTDLAVETNATISTGDFRTLNRCLDDAIAGAVGEYAKQERVAGNRESIRLRDLVYIATSAFEVLRGGTVGVGGATGDLLERSLSSLRDLVDHPPK